MPEVQGIQSTTQQFLDIHDITNDMVVLKDGSTSIVLTVNAMNFGLLAEAEQDAVIYSYAALLNSLNYPIQIVIRSQTKDASSYLQLLQEQEDQSADRTKKEWIRRYKEFVANLIHERNVLDKKFYVVIPASSLEMGITPGQNLVSGFKTQSIEGVEKSVILEKARALLEPKRDHLIAQFNRIGLYARQLKTQEIIQLFYTSYNPEAAEGQQITDSRSYTTPLVEAQIRGVNMTNATTEPTVSAAAPATNTPAMDTVGAAMPTPTPATPPVQSITGIQSPTPASASAATAPGAPTPMTPPVTPGPVPTPSMTPVPMASTPISTPLSSPMSTTPISITPTPAPVANPVISGVSEPMATPLNPTGSPAGSVATSMPTPLSTPPTSNPSPSITESPIVTTPSKTPAASSPATPPTASSEAQIQNELDSALKELSSTGAAKAGPATPPTMPTPSQPVASTGNATPAATDDELPPLPEI